MVCPYRLLFRIFCVQFLIKPCTLMTISMTHNVLYLSGKAEESHLSVSPWSHRQSFTKNITAKISKISHQVSPEIDKVISVQTKIWSIFSFITLKNNVTFLKTYTVSILCSNSVDTGTNCSAFQQIDFIRFFQEDWLILVSKHRDLASG